MPTPSRAPSSRTTHRNDHGTCTAWPVSCPLLATPRAFGMQARVDGRRSGAPRSSGRRTARPLLRRGSPETSRREATKSAGGLSPGGAARGRSRDHAVGADDARPRTRRGRPRTASPKRRSAALCGLSENVVRHARLEAAERVAEGAGRGWSTGVRDVRRSPCSKTFLARWDSQIDTRNGSSVVVEGPRSEARILVRRMFVYPRDGAARDRPDHRLGTVPAGGLSQSRRPRPVCSAIRRRG